MSFEHAITEEYIGGGATRTKRNTYTADAQNSREVAIADSETDFEVALALDVSEIKALYICSTQDVTLETNDGSTPDDTISLKANVPYIWHEDSYHDCLLTTDVTALFITNASGAEATLIIEVAFDSTP